MMSEYTALLAPGIHSLTINDLHALAVEPYPSSSSRPMLLANLAGWLDELKALGAGGRCWLDGSFLTEKPEPGDIDLVLFPTFPVTFDSAQVAHASQLLNQPLMHAQRRLDLYLVNPAQPDVAQWTSYWRGWFGFCRDGITAKGIAEVVL